MAPRRDHPRSRGVYLEHLVHYFFSPGSSPLARGLLSSYPQLLLAPGIIPARAGFTSCRTWRRSTRRDHPRSRGVYGRRTGARCPSTGSSPLARGLRRHGEPDHHRPWIIPARAGFTRRSVSPTSVTRDHPRSRGVYATSAAVRTCSPGSSPLARGLPSLTTPAGVMSGIIPARAGFTAGNRSCRVVRWDHPRSRGVYLWQLASISEPTGSSPLARGLPTIPHSFYDFQRDHPRSRGVYGDAVMRPGPSLGSSPLARGLPENGGEQSVKRRIIPARAGFTQRKAHLSDKERGSSPLARGLLAEAWIAEDGSRIIPARAGFTCSPSRRRRLPGDHPRSRGVYRHRSPPRHTPPGSSPLARGLQGYNDDGRLSGGIIPARAGFTAGP